jgi:hypothetical protein
LSPTGSKTFVSAGCRNFRNKRINGKIPTTRDAHQVQIGTTANVGRIGATMERTALEMLPQQPDTTAPNHGVAGIWS